MDGNVIDLRHAIWEPANILGEHSIFVGDRYPIVRRMPPSIHDAHGLPFMKHGCVFTVHRRKRYWEGPVPDLCRFSFDGTSACGMTLLSCEIDSRCPPLWIVPSMRNAWDWNNEVHNVM
jgi:hypothetical protein